jgi:hypothetical protein
MREMIHVSSSPISNCPCFVRTTTINSTVGEGHGLRFFTQTPIPRLNNGIVLLVVVVKVAATKVVVA